jgi:hypothetical protein
VLACDAESSASEIARVLQTDENQVRRVIRDFNEMGMDYLRPGSVGGRPRRIDDETREGIRAVALARPQDLGEPGTRWSLVTLRRYDLIPTPTYASHLNRIECHFWAYVEFGINGSEYANWSEFSMASRAYIHRRNRDRHDPRILELENRRKVA